MSDFQAIDEIVFLEQKNEIAQLRAELAEERERVAELEQKSDWIKIAKSRLADLDRSNVYWHSKFMDVQTENSSLRAQVGRLKVALRRIAEASGPYDPDPLEHAKNTIRAMAEIAREALEEEHGRDI